MGLDAEIKHKCFKDLAYSAVFNTAQQGLEKLKPGYVEVEDVLTHLLHSPGPQPGERKYMCTSLEFFHLFCRPIVKAFKNRRCGVYIAIVDDEKAKAKIGRKAKTQAKRAQAAQKSKQTVQRYDDDRFTVVEDAAGSQHQQAGDDRPAQAGCISCSTHAAVGLCEEMSRHQVRFHDRGSNADSGDVQ